MITKNITISVIPDDDYRYEVEIADGQPSVSYVESGGLRVELTFGTLEEMRAVAEAMLSAVNTRENL